MDSISTALKFGSALSEADDTGRALAEVIESLRSQALDRVDLLVVVMTPQHVAAIDRVADELHAAFAPRVCMGSTAEGVIGVRREVQDAAGLAVLAASAPGARLKPFVIDQPDWRAIIDDPEQLAGYVGTDVAVPKAVLLIGDPFSTPMMHLLPSFNEALPGMPVIGGMASGAERPGGNRLLLDDMVRLQGAIGVAIGGEIQIDTTVSQGCRPIDKPYVITRSKRHVLLELGGRDPMHVITDVVEGLDEQDRELVRANGLMVGRVINEYKARFGRGDFLIRNLLRSEKQGGHLAINDTNVRVGQTIQFHIRDKATAVEDFTMLLEAQKVFGPAAGALLFTCNGRGRNLFELPNADADMVADALGEIPLAGFFAAGEIGPVAEQNFLHGHTACLVVFRPA